MAARHVSVYALFSFESQVTVYGIFIGHSEFSCASVSKRV